MFMSGPVAPASSAKNTEEVPNCLHQVPKKSEQKTKRVPIV